MEQDQEPKKQGLSNAYNTYRNTRAAASVGRMVAKLAIQLAARAAATIAMSPVGWIAIGIGAVVVVTFLIVFSASSPDFSIEETTTPAVLSPSPTTEPELTGSP